LLRFLGTDADEETVERRIKMKPEVPDAHLMQPPTTINEEWLVLPDIAGCRQNRLSSLLRSVGQEGR